MGYYSEIWFGYDETIAWEVELLFDRKVGTQIGEWFGGHPGWPKILRYYTTGSNPSNHVFPAYKVHHMDSTKWYDGIGGYPDETNIMELVKEMDKDEEMKEHFFFVRIGENQGPEEVDLETYGTGFGESVFEFSLSFGEYDLSDRYSQYETLEEDEFRKSALGESAGIQPYKFGSINEAYIPIWVEHHDVENYITPRDEIWD